MRSTLVILGALLSPLAPGAEGTLTFKPDPDEERPVVRRASVRPQGTDFALTLEFDKTPWGEECKKRCANATLLIDTDGDPKTGLQAGAGKPQTGADLGVLVQGYTDFGEESAAHYIRVKIRALEDNDARMESGDVVADLDHRRDRERLGVEGKEVRIMVDASRATLPAGKKCRLIYLPPLSKPVVVPCRGMGGFSPGSAPDILRSTNSKRRVTTKPYEEPVSR
ncbi:MAG: hypothetical protein M3Y59_25770 [Myxococcota bacterium]|nr:hypothetical protein [Myxococcota bacterium]